MGIDAINAVIIIIAITVTILDIYIDMKSGFANSVLHLHLYSFIYLSIYLSIYHLYIIHPLIHSSTILSTHPSTHPFTHPSTEPSIYLFIYLSISSTKFIHFMDIFIYLIFCHLQQQITTSTEIIYFYWPCYPWHQWHSCRWTGSQTCSLWRKSPYPHPEPRYHHQTPRISLQVGGCLAWPQWSRRWSGSEARRSLWDAGHWSDARGVVRTSRDSYAAQAGRN